MRLKEIFYIDSKVQELFPEIKVGTALIHNVKVSRENSELEDLKLNIIEEVREAIRGQSIPQLPRVKAFRNIYKKFNVDPNSRRPSVEALLRRVMNQNKVLNSVNTVVDAYNITSIQFQLPMAAYDFDKISPPIVLRFAEAGEQYRAIGQLHTEELASSELVYADQANILCRDFNYRDCDQTKITFDSTNLLIIIDGNNEVPLEELVEAIETVSRRITAFNGGRSVEYALFPQEE